MEQFTELFRNATIGVLHGFDRIVFQGFLMPLMYANGAMGFFDRRGILYKDAKLWVMRQTNSLASAVEQWALKECGTGTIYLQSSNTRKEALVRKRQEETGIQTGLIGVWSCVEAGGSYRIIPAKGKPALRWVYTRCKHLYLYMDHPTYGFMHIRVQTWFPYKIQIAMNGREWLSRQLTKAGIGFQRNRNKFMAIDDFEQAQILLNKQLDANWPKVLNSFLPEAFPTMGETIGPDLTYTWTCWQSEWATDLIFRDQDALTHIMDGQVKHAFMTGNAGRLLRYFGRPVNSNGDPRSNFNGSIRTTVGHFGEGVRVRHWIDQNSVKLYNEHNTLRIESTINQPRAFLVHRRKQGAEPTAPKQRLPMRKGVADLVLRAKVSQEVNNRFAEHLGSAQLTTPIRDILAPITQRRKTGGRTVRAIDPIGKDNSILNAISDPKFTLAGFKNSDIRDLLRDQPLYAKKTEKQLSGVVTRIFRILRDHGLIRKLPKQHRYILTRKGRQIATAIQVVLASSNQELMKFAA